MFAHRFWVGNFDTSELDKKMNKKQKYDLKGIHPKKNQCDTYKQGIMVVNIFTLMVCLHVKYTCSMIRNYFHLILQYIFGIF